MTKMITIYIYNEIIVSLMNKVVEVYAANRKGVAVKRLKMIQQFTLITELVLQVGTAMYFHVGGLYFVYPNYAYYGRRKRVSIMPCFHPFIDETFLCAAAVGTVAIDFMFLIIIINVPAFSSIFSENVEELNTILWIEKVGELSEKAKLRNLFLMYREIQL